MTYLRRDVQQLGGDWADPILWYARAVASMRRRPLAEPTSWRFYAAIHGFDPHLWQKLGWLRPSDAPPAQPLIALYWNQGKRAGRDLLAWQRFYLLAFEANIRATLTELGGPRDWALPYWNAFAPNRNGLPPAFVSSDWPDGHGDNPLFSPQRYGPTEDEAGPPSIDGIGRDPANLAAPDIAEAEELRRRIGGTDPQPPHLPGLMFEKATAALDPIFWLHQANIDRLWMAAGTPPPCAPAARIDSPVFARPMPESRVWESAPAEMAEPTRLDYAYDDPSPHRPAPEQCDRAAARPLP